MDKSDVPFDYMAAIEEIRKENRQGRNRFRDPAPVRFQPDEPVDYMAVIRALAAEKAGTRTGRARGGKKNPGRAGKSGSP